MLHELLRKWMPRSRRPHPVRRSSGPWNLMRLEARDVPATIGYAIGAGNGSAPNQVELFDTTGALIVAWNAFPGFAVGTHTALGDINGDGTVDVVVAVAGRGGPEVKVYDGAALALGGSSAQTAIDNPLKDFYAYAPNFTGGVNVAVGDVNGQTSDGTATGARINDIITGPGPGGGPHVKVFDPTLNVLYSFYAYASTFTGGVSVAAGDVGGDTGNPPIHPVSSDDLVTGAGIGGRAHVEVYAVSLTDITQLDRVGQFYAYSTSFFGGVNVAVGSFTNNRDATTQAGLPTSHLFDDIVTGAGPGGGPEVKVWRLDNGQNTGTDSLFSFVTAADFYAYTPKFTGGVTVGTTPNITNPSGTGNALPDFITGVGPGGGPHAIVWNSNDFPTNFGTAANPNGDLATYTPTIEQQQYVYPPNYTGGINPSE